MSPSLTSHPPPPSPWQLSIYVAFKYKRSECCGLKQFRLGNQCSAAIPNQTSGGWTLNVFCHQTPQSSARRDPTDPEARPESEESLECVGGMSKCGIFVTSAVSPSASGTGPGPTGVPQRPVDIIGVCSGDHHPGVEMVTHSVKCIKSEFFSGLQLTRMDTVVFMFLLSVASMLQHPPPSRNLPSLDLLPTIGPIVPFDPPNTNVTLGDHVSASVTSCVFFRTSDGFVWQLQTC